MQTDINFVKKIKSQRMPRTHRQRKVLSGRLYTTDLTQTDEFKELVKKLRPETGVVYGKKFKKKQRQTLAVTLDGVSKYRYSQKVRDHMDAPEFVKKMAKKVEAEMKKSGIEQEFNTAIFTMYLPPSTEDKNDKGDLNWHDDFRGSNLEPHSAVASVVFGEPRKVFMRSKKDHKQQFVIKPGDGHYYCMGPGCQEEEDHRVEKGRGLRYSFTFRTVVRTVS